MDILDMKSGIAQIMREYTSQGFRTRSMWLFSFSFAFLASKKAPSIRTGES